MYKDIRDKVRKCELCALSKPAQVSHLGKLESDVASNVLEKIFIDFVGPYPRSKLGNTYILVCVDAFSKFVWLFPIRQATGGITTRVLKERLFQHFRVSDNAAQFLGKIFKDFCFSLGVTHIITSPYRPQGSHAERFNRNLKSALIVCHAQVHTM